MSSEIFGRSFHYVNCVVVVNGFSDYGTFSRGRGGVVVISTGKLYLTKSELRFYAISTPTCGVSEIWDGGISDSGSDRKKGLTSFVGQPFCENNSSV